MDYKEMHTLLILCNINSMQTWKKKIDFYLVLYASDPEAYALLSMFERWLTRPKVCQLCRISFIQSSKWNFFIAMTHFSVHFKAMIKDSFCLKKSNFRLLTIPAASSIVLERRRELRLALCSASSPTKAEKVSFIKPIVHWRYDKINRMQYAQRPYLGD